MSIFDKFADLIHETNYQITPYSDPIYNQLRGFYAVDKDVSGGYGNIGNSPLDQVNNLIRKTKLNREQLFNDIDLIKHHHIATTVKSIIIDDCFNSMVDKRLATIQYRSDNETTNKLFNEEIEKLLRNTSFLEVFKDCLINEGIDYGEMFLSTKCEVGKGIIQIYDDVNIRNHVAIYKNLVPIGYVKFNKKNDKITQKDYINADDISHFLISPKKISLSISKSLNEDLELPEKVRCAEPLLTPIVDLIIQYNQLEQISTAVEINKALAPILLGIGISPTSDINEIRSVLQQYQVKLNSSRNTIINNLDTLNTKQLLQKMNEIQLVPYNVEEGTNRINQIEVQHVMSDLTDKINNIRRIIALAIGIPESSIASTVEKEKKEDNILSNPRYSRMLSSIQQSLARGVVEFVYKHLRYRFSKRDSEGFPFLERKIDKHAIDVKFKTVTNIDDRLDDENMLLKAETLGNIVGMIDVVTGSPNLPIKTNGDKLMQFWTNLTENYPDLREVFEIDNSIDNRDYLDNYGDEDDLGLEDDLGENPEVPKLPDKKSKGKELDNKEKDSGSSFNKEDINYIRDIYK
ncbi:MAG: hypothetical protein ACOC1K_02115 [Nanoarchaeota archaeon]